MEIITLTGKLHDDATLVLDKKGRNIVRFKVDCDAKDSYNKPQVNQYRCYFYNTEYSTMKAGQKVCLTGAFTVSRYGGQPFFDIYVYQISVTDK